MIYTLTIYKNLSLNYQMNYISDQFIGLNKIIRKLPKKV